MTKQVTNPMLKFLSPLAVLIATHAAAENPRVVTDIAPIHSLTAQVMAGVGMPDLIVQPGTEVHDLALRPSDASRIARADVIIWVGAEMTPWLIDPLEALAPTAATLTLLDVPGWVPLMTDDDTIDPHAWLDPEVAIFWLQAIRDTLTATDPDNAAAYSDNADRHIAHLIALKTSLSAALSGVRDKSYVTPHDAFGYFEARFGLTPAGSTSDTHDHAPGPAHLQELRDILQSGQVSCVLSETGGSADFADVLREGTRAKTARIDAISMGITPGPDLYAALLTDISDTLVNCTRD